MAHTSSSSLTTTSKPSSTDPSRRDFLYVATACAGAVGIAASLVTVSGNAKQFVRVGDEGGRATFNFCPHCGSTVYYTIEGDAESMAIPVGAFADPSFPAPGVSVYEERMHAWVSMPRDMQHMA